MFEMLTIVCTVAALSEGGCVSERPPDDVGPRPDAYEMRVGGGTYQLSYAGSGHDFDAATLTEHWRRRAALICAGQYRGRPMVEMTYPAPGYEAMVSFLPIAGSRTYNVEVYGVAHCLDVTR